MPLYSTLYGVIKIFLGVTGDPGLLTPSVLFSTPLDISPVSELEEWNRCKYD